MIAYEQHSFDEEAAFLVVVTLTYLLVKLERLSLRSTTSK